MITTWISSWLLNKFSLSARQEMYMEQYGEYAYWCSGVKDKHKWQTCNFNFIYINLINSNYNLVMIFFLLMPID